MMRQFQKYVCTTNTHFSKFFFFRVLETKPVKSQGQGCRRWRWGSACIWFKGTYSKCENYGSTRVWNAFAWHPGLFEEIKQ